MNLDPTQRELFRNALLRVLAANGTRFGLTHGALAAQVVRFGFWSSFVASMPGVMLGESQEWKRSPSGHPSPEAEP